jgi:[ribosomal protein S18]-alanine N-acetyltransferase
MREKISEYLPFHIQITPLVLEEIPEIVEIEKESHLEPWSSQSFVNEIGRLHSHSFVARIAEAKDNEESGSGRLPGPAPIVGYICFWCVADEVQILNVTVRRDFRQRGIGRALLNHALQIGRERKARVAVLEVRQSNIAAQVLYESFGFVQAGLRPGYYDVVKESAVIMELELIEE